MKITKKIPFSMNDFKKGRKVYEMVCSLDSELCTEVVPTIDGNKLKANGNEYNKKGKYLPLPSYATEFDEAVDLFHDGDDNFAKFNKQKKQYYYYVKKKDRV